MSTILSSMEVTVIRTTPIRNELKTITIKSVYGFLCSLKAFVLNVGYLWSTASII